MHHDLFTMITEARAAAHPVSITTNGLLLDRFAEQLLDSGLERLAVSLDSVERTCNGVERQQSMSRQYAEPGPNAMPPTMLLTSHTTNTMTTPLATPTTMTDQGHGNGERILEHLRILLDLARKKGRQCPPPEIILLITLQNDGGHGARTVVAAAARLGIRHVKLVRLNHWGREEECSRPGKAEEARIVASVERCARRAGVRVDHNASHFSGLPRRLYRLLRPWLYQRDTRCSKPLDYLFVRANGDITPCCDLSEPILGNVLLHDLPTIWNGAARQEFLTRPPSRCGNCDHLLLQQRNRERGNQ